MTLNTNCFSRRVPTGRKPTIPNSGIGVWQLGYMTTVLEDGIVGRRYRHLGQFFGLGHKKYSLALSVYSTGLKLPELKAVVKKISYENFDLRHLHKPKLKTKAIPANRQGHEANPLR